MHRPLVATAAAVASGLLVSFVLAQEDAKEPLRVAYTAPDGCPSGASFFDAIASRTTRVRAAQAAEAGRTVRVTIAARAGEFAGDLVIVDVDGAQTSRRTVRASTCADVSAALALVAALAIDPNAKTAPALSTTTAGATPAAPSGASTAALPPASGATAPGPSAPVGSAAAIPASAAPAGGASAPTVSTASRRRTPRDAPEGPSVPSTRVSPEVGAGADALSFFGIKPLFSVWGGLVWDSRLAPSLRLRLSRSPGYSVGAVGEASAFMILTTFALEGCPASLASGRFGATACARVAPGFLEARGVNLTNAVSTLRPWFDVGLLLRGRLTIVGPLDFELEVGGRAPLLRETFTVSSTQELVRAAPVLLSLAAGISLRFR